MISTPGPLELLVILGLALLVLGPNRLPDAARSAGKAYRDFRAALSGDHEDEDEFAAGDEYDLAEAGPAAEAEYREEVAGEEGDAETAGDDDAAELAEAGPAGEAAYREKTAGTGTEAGDPAPPPVS
jgi:sec-independent protein translocase protein TatA